MTDTLKGDWAAVVDWHAALRVVAEQAGVSHETARKKKQALGIAPNRNGPRGPNPVLLENLTRIQAALAASGMAPTRTNLKRHYHMSESQISYLKRAYGLVTVPDHAYGVRLPSTKLSADQVREIRRRHSSKRGDGAGYEVLGHEFGVTKATICQVVRRISHKHVEDA